MGYNHSDDDVERLDDWFSRQNVQRILYVGGNHDFAIERRAGEGAPVFRNAVYLQDEAYRFGGVNFYGAPWIPELYSWAFYQPTVELRRRWALVPNDTDVLITHTPPRTPLIFHEPAGQADRDEPFRPCFSFIATTPEVNDHFDARLTRDVLRSAAA